jgi:PBSX family phage terminase large subunit
VAIIQRAIQAPGSKHLVTRLRENHLAYSLWSQTLLPAIREYCPGVRIKHSRKPLLLEIGGSEIWGLALDQPERIEKIMGTQFSTVFINEATQVPYATYQAVKTRAVDDAAGRLDPKIVVDCNPANQYHWIHRYFLQHEDPESGEQVKHAKSLFRRGPWLPTDNDRLSDRGRQVLESLTGVAYDRLVKGLWVGSEGLVYPDFEQAVVEPFPVTGWDLFAAADFGFTNPFVFLLFALDRANETYYLIDEYRSVGRTALENCQALKKRKPEYLSGSLALEWIVADHDAGDRATMAQQGLRTLAADKDIKSGVQSVRDLIGAKRGTKLRIFATCQHTRNEAMGYRYPAEKHGDDRDEKPVKENDHCMDALRYFAKRVTANKRAVATVGKRGG